MLRRVLALATLLGVLAGCSDDGPENPEPLCVTTPVEPSSEVPSAPPAAGAPRAKMDRPLGGRVRPRPTGGNGRPRATTGQQHPPQPARSTRRHGVELGEDDQPEAVTETVVCAG